MLSRDYRDIAGGILLVVVGLGFSWYASANYNLGTIQRMGPGMFPAGLGIGLAILGVFQMIPAFFRPGKMPEIRVWSPLFILLSVAAFALMIRPVGLIPAVLAVIWISSLAELRLRVRTLLIESLVLCVLVWLLFTVGLGLSIPLFRWPF